MKKSSLLVVGLLAVLSLSAYATQKDITVEFKPGTVSASYKGSVKPDPQVRGELHDTYKLRAKKGQMMKIEVSATGPVGLYIWRGSMGYNQGYLMNTGGDRKLTTRFILPADDTYHVSVDKGFEGPGIDYDVKFSIR